MVMASDSVFMIKLEWVHNGQTIPKFDKFDKICNIKKAAMVLNFCLIFHSFLVSRMID